MFLFALAAVTLASTPSALFHFQISTNEIKASQQLRVFCNQKSIVQFDIPNGFKIARDDLYDGIPLQQTPTTIQQSGQVLRLDDWEIPLSFLAKDNNCDGAIVFQRFPGISEETDASRISSLEFKILDETNAETFIQIRESDGSFTPFRIIGYRRPPTSAVSVGNQ